MRADSRPPTPAERLLGPQVPGDPLRDQEEREVRDGALWRTPVRVEDDD